MIALIAVLGSVGYAITAWVAVCICIAEWPDKDGDPVVMNGIVGVVWPALLLCLGLWWPVRQFGRASRAITCRFNPALKGKKWYL